MSVWSKTGDGIPKPQIGRTVLLRMRQHHAYESAVREERILVRLEEIVRIAIRDFKCR